MPYRVEAPPKLGTIDNEFAPLSYHAETGDCGDQRSVRLDKSAQSKNALVLVYRKIADLSGPIRIAPWLIITDVAKSNAANLRDLESYVLAKNAGQRNHCVENILPEKLEKLRICGIEAEVRSSLSPKRQEEGA